MKKETKPVAKSAGKKKNEKFHFIFHIGAGKTGTSSIQESLKLQQEKLKQEGIWYLGLMLEHAPSTPFAWQRAGGSQEFLALDSEKATAEVLQVLRESIPEMQAQGCHQAIWSNEWFFGHGTTPVLDAMRKLSEEGIEVEIIAYVRRHDAWVRSAYVQWGLKHKTYEGPILPFSKWISVRPKLPNFYNSLKPWLEVFGKSVTVRNLDAAGDAVADFMKITGINADKFEKVRTNETPSGEELLLRTLFNSEFSNKVPVNKFDEVMDRDALYFDRPISDFFSQLLPTETELAEIAKARGGDRSELDELLKASGQSPIDTSPLRVKPATVDSGKLMTAICQLVVKQAIKLHDMEKTMNQMTSPKTEVVQSMSAAQPAVKVRRDASADAPVFAISTGRSGSTLVQRVLNCHQDLVVWGEHFGFLESLGQAYVQMKNPEQKLYQENPGPSILLPTLQDPAKQLEWVNPCGVDDYKEYVRNFLDSYFGSQLGPNQRWGFKEIRYNSLPVLRMLRDCYPKGKFVFIERDPIEVTRSKVFSFIKEDKWQGLSDEMKTKRVANLLTEVREHYQLYDTFMQRNPGRGIIVHYEALVETPREVTTELMNFLELDLNRFDWTLGNQVMGSIIAKTKRDSDVVDFIRSVSDSLSHEVN